MVQVLFWSAIVRIVQASVEAAPTVIVGILVAAIFQRVLGRDQTLTVFGGRTWRQIPQAWAMGMLLPVCSLGAIPVMTELRKAGLVGGTILAFGLTAPIFNPLSVLYGLTLSHPSVILTICLCSLALVTVMGLLWDRLFKNEFLPTQPISQTPYGIRRIAIVFLAMFRIAYSRDMIYMAIGVVGVGLLSMLLPANSLQQSAEADDITAPLKMAAIALPAYITPMTAMVQLASMFQHGNSIAAAFALLILGTGLNIGMMAWIGQTFEWKKAMVWIGVCVLLVLLIAYAIDRPLYPKGVTSEGHTHAFDGFCRPIPDESLTPIETTKSLIYESTPAFAGYSLGILGVLVLSGGVLKLIDPNQKWEQALATISVTNSIGRDFVIPPRIVGLLALGGLVGVSIYGCYIYYPNSSVVYEQLQVANAEVCTRVSSKDWPGALHWIPSYEDWLRKLQVGMYLRGETFSEDQHKRLMDLTRRIEELEDHITGDDLDTAGGLGKKIAYEYYQFRQSVVKPKNSP